jgi:hypothetical protein
MQLSGEQAPSPCLRRLETRSSGPRPISLAGASAELSTTTTGSAAARNWRGWGICNPVMHLAPPGKPKTPKPLAGAGLRSHRVIARGMSEDRGRGRFKPLGALPWRGVAVLICFRAPPAWAPLVGRAYAGAARNSAHLGELECSFATCARSHRLFSALPAIRSFPRHAPELWPGPRGASRVPATLVFPSRQIG